MAHAPARRRGRAGDEPGDRLFAVLPDPFRRFFLRAAADFANHDDAVRVGIVVEHFNDLEMRCSIDRVAADADARGLPCPAAGELPDCFVGERAAARDDADVALLVNVAGRDADAATAVRILAFAGRHDAGTIRADEARLTAFHRALHLDHVVDRNALGDANDQVQPAVNRFKDGVGGEWRGNENRGRGRAGLFRGLSHGVKDRHSVLKKLSALAWCDAGDDLSAVFQAELGVPRAEAAGDALHEDSGLRSDEDGHVEFTIGDLRFTIFALGSYFASLTSFLDGEKMFDGR